MRLPLIIRMGPLQTSWEDDIQSGAQHQPDARLPSACDVEQVEPEPQQTLQSVPSVVSADWVSDDANAQNVVHKETCKLRLPTRLATANKARIVAETVIEKSRESLTNRFACGGIDIRGDAFQLQLSAGLDDPVIRCMVEMTLLKYYRQDCIDWPDRTSQS